MRNVKKAGNLNFIAMALIAVVILAAGLITPGTADAAYEYGWKQSDGTGQGSNTRTRDTYMLLTAPATNNMRVISIGHLSGNSTGVLRLGLYADTDTIPTNATLIEDLGVVNFTNASRTWQWFDLTTPYDMAPGSYVGITYNDNGSGTCPYSYSNTNGGSTFDCTQYYYGNRAGDYTTAFPSSYPSTATTYTYTYAHHIVYVLYPTISGNPSSLNDSTAGYTITGDGFEAMDEFTSQGQPYNAGRSTTSEVWLTQNNNWAAPGTKVAQTITAWNNTSITFTSNFGALTPGSTAYLWVENSDGEHNASGIAITLNSPSSPGTFAGTASAVIASNTQINVTMPYVGDSNADGSCTVEYNTSDTWPGTAAPCSPVSGASPRTCNISGLTVGNTYYVSVTYNDPDGVVGTATQVLGPYTMQLDIVAGTAMAVADSANQITITAPFTGDVNDNSSTLVEYNTTNSWPGTTKCASLTGTPPRVCVVDGLSPATSYYFRVTHTDADGVTGTNPQVIGPIATEALPTLAPTVSLITPGNWPARDGQVALKQKVGIVVYNPNSVGLTVNSVALNNNSTLGWGTVNSTAGTYGPMLPSVGGDVITWTGPVNVPAYGALSFFCEMNVTAGTGNSGDINMTATVNDGIFNQTATVPMWWSHRSYTTGTYAYMGTESNPVYCVGEDEALPSGAAYPFTVEFRVPAASNSSGRYDWHGPSSTTQPTNPAQVINVSIPAGWTNVTAPVTQGIWNGVTVSGNSGAGWTINGSISPSQAMGPAAPSCGDFVTTLNFTATPPTGLNNPTGYIFQVNFGDTNHARLIEDYSTSCTVNTNGTNRSALDVRGGFVVMVDAGDISPPANVTAFTGTAADNTATLSWTNPTTDQGGGGLTGFDGILILRNTSPISNVPATGTTYSVDGVGGPNTIGTSRVVYVGSGTGLMDGDACIPSARLVNGTNYYYRAFSFDPKRNYSSGASVNSPTDYVKPTDSINPGAVTGVGTTPADKKITITWTNPSDCDLAGVRVRYSNSAFPTDYTGVTDSSILAGSKIGGTPGAADQLVHNSLVNGTPYYYTVWAFDDEGIPLWSAPASPATYAAPYDNVPPGQITDLTVVPGSETAFTITLQWSAPADSGYDPATGNASKYYLRYYKEPIDEANWNLAWLPGGEWLPQPVAAGTLQSYLVSGLSPLHDYYFAIRTVDEVDNMSLISNNEPGTTLCNEELTACDQCHQMPPTDGLPGQHPRATGNIGKHSLPIHAGAGEAEVCNVCHTNGEVWRNNTTLYGYNHQNFIVDINDPGKIGNKDERDAGTGGTFIPYTEIIYKFMGYSTGVGYKQVTGYCSETYCHGAGLSSPRWGIDEIVCGEYCHETPPATGKHVKHYHPGQHYINFAPTGTQVSGYVNVDELDPEWTSGTVVTGDNGPDQTLPLGTPRGNRDDRYRTYIETTDAMFTEVLPAGSWYITVCAGDSDLVMQNQHIEVSGDGGATWVSLMDNFDCRPEKHFNKAVDVPFTVVGANNMMLHVGNGVDATRILYMIVNSTPEAPKTNNTILQNTAAAYGFNCGKCHTADGSQAGHTGHVNGAVIEDFRDAEIHFDANSFPKNPLGNYTAIFDPVSSYMDGQGFNYTLGAQCANLYCHGSTLNAGGSNPTPTWEGGYVDVEGASLCGACHEAGYADTTPTTNMDTGSHNKHVSVDYAYRVDCYKCHNHTVGAKSTETGIIPISDKTHHVNGDVDAVFDPNDNTMKFGRYSTSILTCFEVYCHSNGLLKNNQPYWATEYAEPVWNSGSKSCNYCHGTSTTDGHPAYANTSTTPNSHGQHNEANGIGCTVCHYETTRDNGLTIYTTHQPSYHVNATRDVTFNPAITGGTFNPSNLECSNTYCHGLTAPPRWGQATVTCGSCHGDGLANPNPGIGAHDKHNNGTYDSVSTVVTNGSTSADYDFSCRFCHFSRTHGGGEYIPGTQAAEVNFNTIDPTSSYNNTGATYITGGTVSQDGNGWNYTNGQCANLMCHSDGHGGPPNNTTFTWTDTLACDQCHSATDAYTNKMSSGHHSTHVWSSVYRRNCHDCHYDTVFNAIITDKSKHVDGNIDVAMSPSFGGFYDAPTHTCNTVFCHSNGDPAMWNGPESDWHVMINWTSTEGTTCTTCHSNNYYPAGDGIRLLDKETLSFNHGGHLTNYSARIGCNNCHAKTAATNTSIQPTIPSVHNNGKKNISFYTTFFNHTGLSEDGLGYWGNWNDSPVDGNCTVICHSDGNGNNPVMFPNWSSVSGSLGCGGCHGTTGTLTSGSHTMHASTQNLDCGVCHSTTAVNNAPDNDGETAISAAGYSTNHVNGTKEVVLSASVGGTWSGGSQTCTTSCHPSGSPVWGTAASCIDCHGVTGAETDDFTYGNATKATVNLTEYTTSGHGRTTAFPYTGKPAANKACEDCHSTLVAHDNAANPFRLMSSATIKPTQPDTLCNSCHTEGSHDFAHVGQGTWNWTPKCIDCHDPHGDAAGISGGEYNGAMIQSDVSYTASSTYGVPGTTEAVDFPANFAVAQGGNFLNWSSFVVTTGQSNKGICRVCHTEATTTYFTRTAYDGSHNYGSVCTSCHPHDAGFKPAACNACHGDPPNLADSKADNVGAVGAHDLHANTLSIACLDCHGHNGSGGQHNETAALGGYSSLIPGANVDIDVSAIPDYHGATPTYNGTPGGWSTQKTCSNAGCHYGESKGWDCQ